MADLTTLAESSQALFCAVADLAGSGKTKSLLNLGEYPTYTLFKRKQGDLIKRVVREKRIVTPGVTITNLEEFLIKNEEWYESSVLIAAKLMDQIHLLDRSMPNFKKFRAAKFQNVFYFRGDKQIMGNIAELWKIANNNTAYWTNQKLTKFGDINKWNPADIYFATPIAITEIAKELKKAHTNKALSYSIDNLNMMMNRLMKSGDLFPLSLKKQTKTVHLQKVNFDKKKKIEILENVVYKDLYKNELKKYPWYKPVPVDKKGLPVRKTDPRDINLGIVSANNTPTGNLQCRHDPSAGGWKVDFKYKGAQARGGSLVSHTIFASLLNQHAPGVGTKFLSEYNKGNENFKEEMKRNIEPKKLKIKARGGDAAYNHIRGEVSAVHLINRVMPIIVDWLKRAKPEVKTAFVRTVFQYVTSRAEKAGRFVIAK